MELELYIIGIISVFTGAVYGAYFALKEKMDIFGIFVSAFLAAVAGGTLREIMFNTLPIYFYDANFIYAIIAATIFTITIYKCFHRIETIALLFDAVGLVTFAFIGAEKATSEGLGTIGIVFFATLTAIGGGMVRDIVFNKTPTIMYNNEVYALIAVLLGITYSLFQEYMNMIWAIHILLGFFFFIRVFVIFFPPRVWNPSSEI